MITNFSEEHIEIKGKEYILFLNRKGIVSWENITKFSTKAEELQHKYKDKKDILSNNNDEPIKVENDTNPFDYSSSEQLDKIEKDEEILRDIYVKFYWIALYEKQKLSLSKVEELFEEAEKEYGIEQLILLANQMIEDTNKNKYGNTELKKLTALRQTK